MKKILVILSLSLIACKTVVKDSKEYTAYVGVAEEQAIYSSPTNKILCSEEKFDRVVCLTEEDMQKLLEEVQSCKP